MEEPLAHDRSLVSWIMVLTVVAALLTWLFASPRWVGQMAVTENEYIRGTFGEGMSEKIMDNAVSIATRVHKTITKRLNKRSTTQWGATRGETARRLLVLYIQRLENMLMMGVLLFPLVVAAAVDGWTYRNIAKSTLAMIKQTRFQIGTMLVGTTVILPLAFLIVPLPVHPYFFALYWILLSMGLRMVARHTHYEI